MNCGGELGSDASLTPAQPRRTIAAAGRRATVDDGGLVGSLGDSPGAPPRYAGGDLSNAPPRYPFLSRRRGQEGRVVLRAQVTASGDPAAVRVHQSGGYRLLDAAAVAAVEAWRFVPASRDGIPVVGSVDVPVSFKLTD
ncbi:MAG: energy transducer TonB [SAR324 cluster bacterium]|nr:energy transducer TonB [SAR324 cluster bacterium]